MPVLLSAHRKREKKCYQCCRIDKRFCPTPKGLGIFNRYTKTLPKKGYVCYSKIESIASSIAKVGMGTGNSSTRLAMVYEKTN